MVKVSYAKRLMMITICCGFLFIVGCNKEQHTSEADGFAIDGDVSFDENDYEPIVPATNKLGIDLIRDIEPDEQQNRFISPLSLFSALSMAYMGADETTKEEMAHVMNLGQLTDEQVQKGHASLYELISSLPDETTLHTANALWIDHQYATNDDYANVLKNYFNATFQSDDFSQASTADHMNEWVEDQTNGLITDMVDGPLSADLVLMLLNTLYFKGDWMHPFDESLTEIRAFQTSSGPKDIPMMTLSEDLAYTETDRAQAIVLPYGEGEVEMNIFLPKEGHSIDEMIDLAAELDWQEWRESLPEKKGTLHLPSFELDYESSLNEALQQLGMETAFSGDASFPHMIEGDDDLLISTIKQKSKIIVDEVGTEAASATSIAIETTSASIDPPFTMDVNRPFFFTLTETESGTVLFMGAVEEPNVIEE